MYEILLDALWGIFKGIVSGTVAFFAVMLLSIVYRYFTNEKLSSFIGIAFGLGFWGFSGGLLAILETPTVGGALEIVAVAIFVVWGVNTGDKIAERIPKKGISLFGPLRGGKPAYTTIKLPNARLIHDIVSKPVAPASLKAELSEREFILPSDLPASEIASRVKRRLITDWGVGDVELELGQDGKIIHLAISAKEQGLSALIPEGKVAIPIECAVLPSNLAAGDMVKIFLDDNEVLERVELKGVDENRKVVTIVAKASMLEKIRGKKASLIVALPSAVSVHPSISVAQESGVIEEFQISKIVTSLGKIGVTGDAANAIVMKVQTKLGKMDPPVSTRLIKAVVVEELEKVNPEAAKKLKARRFWK
ncbi:MAG: hypothetical protein NWE94_05300 [Candidatus Bathyarchaeota archaeon]|nr:hypothetical protein [Candidatus Bathyarchaeota archaeon]